MEGKTNSLNKRIIVKCVICFKDFERHRYRKDRVYCSRNCQHDHIRMFRKPMTSDYIYIRGVIDGKPAKILEHREIMSCHLGRPLKNNEHIHHIDGNPRNNSIDNLLVCSPTEHAKIHAKERLDRVKNDLSLRLLAISSGLDNNHLQTLYPLEHKVN